MMPPFSASSLVLTAIKTAVTVKCVWVLAICFAFCRDKKAFARRNLFELLVVFASIGMVLAVGFHGERTLYCANLFALVVILREWHPGRSFCMAAFAVVALILWGLYRAELFSLPAELRLFFDPAETAAETGKPAPSVYDILRDAGAETDPAIPVYRFSGDFSVLRSLLAQSRPRDAWYTETETFLRAGKEENTVTVCFWRLGDSYRIERRNGGKTTEIYICDGSNIYYKDVFSSPPDAP